MHIFDQKLDTLSAIHALNGNASLRSDAQNHLYKCELNQGLLKSILGLWWSGGLFLASKGYMDGEAIGRPPEGEI